MHFKKYLYMCIISGLTLTHVVPVCADIYRYIDSKGIIHFTNVPTSSGYNLYLQQKTYKKSYSTNRFDRYIEKASKKYELSFYLLKAVIKVESNFNPNAVSRAGAMGLMQIMPGTMRELNISDPFNPVENIMGGARFLKKQIDRFDGKLPLALAAYNAGPSAVERYNGIPPFRETKSYVNKVIDNFYAYKSNMH